MVDLGSAGWSDFVGYKPKATLNGGNLIIGEYPFPLGKEGFFSRKPKRAWYAFPPEKHFLTIGGTRGGKGTGLIIPNLLTYSGSCIVIDPKGENAWITAAGRAEKGQKVYILDPWGEVNRRYGEKAGELETVSGFNPLSILDHQSPHYADDVAYLADALILSQGNDPHWSDSGRELVAGLIAYLAETYGQVATLAGLRLLITKGAAGISEIAEKAAAFGADSLANRKLARFVEINKENSSIISTVLTQTAFLDSAALAQSLSQSDFSFDELVQGRATIYLVLPVDKLMTYGRWLRLMLSIAIRTVARNTRPLGLPVLFMLDEFGTIGKLSAIAQAFGLMAGLQMCVWAFLQDLNQLKRDYPDDWETFIANAQTITIFGLQDQTTCKYFSDLIGTTTLCRESILSAEEKAKGKPGQMSDQYFSRPLVHPDELRRRRTGIIIGRHNPIEFDLLSYYNQPEFLQVARHDPYFPDMKSRIEYYKEKFNEEEKKNIQKLYPKADDVQEFLEDMGYGINVEESGGFLTKKRLYKVDGLSTELDEKNFIEFGQYLIFDCLLEDKQKRGKEKF